MRNIRGTKNARMFQTKTHNRADVLSQFLFISLCRILKDISRKLVPSISDYK